MRGMILRPCQGSSPRMRGAQPLLTLEWASPGIIPADAGSTAGLAHMTDDHRDHPRGCGEHDYVDTLLKAVQGSSPRMRGAHVGSETLEPFRGIIPADAGSTITKK